MVDSKIAISPTNLNSVRANSKVIVEGSSLFVKVTSDNGNGKYSGIVGGVRISFSSQNPLKVGQSFIATVSAKDGKILLTPKPDLMLHNNSENFLSKSSNLNNILAKFGLPVDEISIHILKQMKQLGISFNNSKITKNYTQSLRFKGKERQISELISILNERELDFSDEDLKNLIYLLDKNEDYSEEDDYSLINKINSIKGCWYFFLYELKNLDNTKVFGHGNLKLFFRNSMGLEKINLFCSYKNRKYVFNMNFKSEVLQNISLNVSDINKSKIPEIVEKISTLFSNVEVEWKEMEELSGTDCDEEEFYTVNGNA